MTSAALPDALLSVESVEEAVAAYLAAGLRPILTHAPTSDGGCTCGKPHDVTASGSTSIGKHPISSNWSKHEFTLAELRDQIARSGFVPNVGIVLGTQPSGVYLVAVDVDDAERFAALESELGPLPETPRCDSGRGFRLFYKLPEGVDPEKVKNVTALGGEPGVDVKVEGGQVVVAPSLHANGTRYRWTRVGVIASLPIAWALRLVKPAPHGKPLQQGVKLEPREKRPPMGADRATAYLHTAIDEEAFELARTVEGSRNQKLNDALCSLLSLARGVGADDSIVTEALSSAARSAGLPPREVESTVRSALAWANRTHAIRVPELHETPRSLVYIGDAYIDSRPKDERPEWGVIKLTITNQDGSLALAKRSHVVLPLPGSENSRPRYDAIVGAEIDPWDLYREQGPLARRLLVGRELSAVVRGNAMPIAERTGRNLLTEIDAMLTQLGDAERTERCHAFLRKAQRNLFEAHAWLVAITNERRAP